MADDTNTGASTETALSFGQKAVGLTFNPSNDPQVQAIKQASANLIDLCNDIRTKTESGEVKRLMSVAITEAQVAQMMAVKAVTWND
jgi:hypothetical protein